MLLIKTASVKEIKINACPDKGGRNTDVDVRVDVQVNLVLEKVNGVDLNANVFVENRDVEEITFGINRNVNVLPLNGDDFKFKLNFKFKFKYTYSYKIYITTLNYIIIAFFVIVFFYFRSKIFIFILIPYFVKLYI